MKHSDEECNFVNLNESHLLTHSERGFSSLKSLLNNLKEGKFSLMNTKDRLKNKKLVVLLREKMFKGFIRTKILSDRKKLKSADEFQKGKRRNIILSQNEIETISKNETENQKFPFLIKNYKEFCKNRKLNTQINDENIINKRIPTINKLFITDRPNDALMNKLIEYELVSNAEQDELNLNLNKNSKIYIENIEQNKIIHKKIFNDSFEAKQFQSLNFIAFDIKGPLKQKNKNVNKFNIKHDILKQIESLDKIYTNRTKDENSEGFSQYEMNNEDKRGSIRSSIRVSNLSKTVKVKNNLRTISASMSKKKSANSEMKYLCMNSQDNFYTNIRNDSTGFKSKNLGKIKNFRFGENAVFTNKFEENKNFTFDNIRKKIRNETRIINQVDASTTMHNGGGSLNNNLYIKNNLNGNFNNDVRDKTNNYKSLNINNCSAFNNTNQSESGWVSEKYFLENQRILNARDKHKKLIESKMVQTDFKNLMTNRKQKFQRLKETVFDFTKVPILYDVNKASYKNMRKTKKSNSTLLKMKPQNLSKKSELDNFKLKYPKGDFINPDSFGPKETNIFKHMNLIQDKHEIERVFTFASSGK